MHKDFICTWSWLAAKDLYTTILVLKAGHPGVLGFVCRYVYMLCMGGRGWELSTLLGWVPSLYTLSASVLHTCIFMCIHMYVHVCRCDKNKVVVLRGDHIKGN